MAIPKPGTYESENEFLKRAMSDQEFRGMFEDEKTALAVLRGQLWARDHVEDQDQDQGEIRGESAEEIYAAGGHPLVTIQGIVRFDLGEN